jgi:glycosyltransferase involved in cell wall biosynthesis
LSGLSDSELRGAYDRAQLTFLPLGGAAANNAILESLAMGVPIVTTDLSATRFYVGAEAGWYIANSDIEGCVASLTRLINDPAQQQVMAIEARARAEAEFGWNRVADSYRALYRLLLSPRSRAY